jgi:hypothetical protein
LIMEIAVDRDSRAASQGSLYNSPSSRMKNPVPTVSVESVKQLKAAVEKSNYKKL